MKTLNVMFFTGRTEFNREIEQALEGLLKGFAIDIVEVSDEADIVVCTPDFINTFQEAVVIVLTDSSEFLEENDCYIDDENIVSDIMKVINMRKLRYC